MLLGINVDHVATLRQARLTDYPDPVEAALLAEQSGADSITVHLREDRRHIQDHDVTRLRNCLQTRLNLEMGISEEMLDIAIAVRPDDCCLVPEHRAELTTEGGLDVLARPQAVRDACARLRDAGIRVSLFIDPELRQVDAAKVCGADAVELHTGCFADARSAEAAAAELDRVRRAAGYAADLGLVVNAGHGLHYGNVAAIAGIRTIVELNIGHAIVARAVIDGLAMAVREMKHLMIDARQP